ncbi:hypothetical protein [Streptomyces lomondensis]|uniref:AAA+ ATPase domain-containing protein n=1 Tax=Streptomyces lomondensis TaxID=68229 RepID=A0ABQ2X3E9_9ACTN|nr:hypothetical protein [Streptomyces lomondensis]MCF0079998.1 hypothetical protein [Streptomyces lomondensis]GGW96845.1 hypothetical protein GCM10010383_28270 [Streptomyces lomondensis]
MAANSADTWYSNPFPLVPVVRLGPSADLGEAPVEAADSGNAHVPTQILTELQDLVRDYLRDRPRGGRRGRAIAVVGEFGLGKSHAAREVCNELARPDGPALWIVDEPVQDFGRMYRDRLRGPADTPEGRAAFEELVRDYYAYVTAVRVGEQSSGPRPGRPDGVPLDDIALDDIATGLRDRVLDPDKVVSALRYDPEVLHADLRVTLGEVTEHRRFATALALLQDPRFTSMVWAWLTGDEPAQQLRERGIRDAVSGIDPVFDALAVQGFLHGRVGKPYVLLIDSLEKVLDWPEEPRRTFVDAFERLVNVYVSRGGLLVFCTSPRGLNAFRPSLHERVVQLWPTRFTAELTAELVAEYSGSGARPAPGAGAEARERWPSPFGSESVVILQELTGGVPREILKTCHHAWQLSEDGHGAVREVTAATVLRAVRGLHDNVSADQVLATIHDALALGQWRIASSDPVPARAAAAGEPLVAYWLEPVPNAYIAIVVTPSVLVADDEERITARVRALRSALHPARAEVLLVVNGHVSRTMRDRLARSLGSQPLVYRPGDFPRAVNEALDRLRTRLTQLRQEADLADLTSELRSALGEHSSQLGQLRRTVSDLARRDLVAAAPGPARSTLPEPVEVRFEEVFALLDAAVERLAGRPPGGDLRGGPPLRPGRADLAALGCATLVRQLTERFRTGADAWYRAASPGAPSEEQWARLRRVCREYETAVEVLPVQSLGSSGPAHRPTPARAVEALADEVWGGLVSAVRAP